MYLIKNQYFPVKPPFLNRNTTDKTINYIQNCNKKECDLFNTNRTTLIIFFYKKEEKGVYS